MTAVLRLIHISDMHFASSIVGPMHKMQEWVPFPTGLETHSNEAMRKLSLSVRMERLNACEHRVVDTGDQTTLGTKEAFLIAHTYLRSQIPLGRIPYGLNDPNTFTRNEVRYSSVRTPTPRLCQADEC